MSEVVWLIPEISTPVTLDTQWKPQSLPSWHRKYQFISETDPTIHQMLLRLTLPGTLHLPRSGLAGGGGWSSKNRFCKQATQGIGLTSDQMHKIDLKAGLEIYPERENET